jgi:hypothetical protein
MINCAKGKFLISKPISTGEIYISTFKLLEPIRLPRLCAYNFKFYRYYYCLSNNCDDAMDTLTLRLKNQTGDFIDVYRNVFKSSKDEAWVQETVIFEPDEAFSKSFYVTKKLKNLS